MYNRAIKKRGRRRATRDSSETNNHEQNRDELTDEASLGHGYDISFQAQSDTHSLLNEQSSPTRHQPIITTESPVLDQLGASTITGRDGFAFDHQQDQPATSPRRRISRSCFGSQANGNQSRALLPARSHSYQSSSFPPIGTPHRSSRYPALEKLMPLLAGIIDLDLACELLDVYFTEPDGSWFRSSSPYILSAVIRKQAMTRSESTRPISPALVVTILWTITQTVASTNLLRPGRRVQLSSQLQNLAQSLFHEHDADHWHRHEGWQQLRRHQ